MPSPNFCTGTLHWTNIHTQDKPEKCWIIYFHSSDKHWYELNFKENLISARGSYRQEGSFEFCQKKRSHAPKINSEHLDSADMEAMVKFHVFEFGEIKTSLGLPALLHEFAELCRRNATPVDELLVPPLFLLWLLDKIKDEKKRHNTKGKNSNASSNFEPELSITVNKHWKAPARVQGTRMFEDAEKELKNIKKGGPNKTGFYLIPDPEVEGQLALFAWVSGNFIENNGKQQQAQGKCLRFSADKESPNSISLHSHDLKGKKTGKKRPFVASISLDYFMDRTWKDCVVDVNEPWIPHAWWQNKVKMLADANNPLVEEYGNLIKESRERGGPKFSIETFLARILDRISVLPHDMDKNIAAMYEKGKEDLLRHEDLLRSRRHTWCLTELEKPSAPKRAQSVHRGRSRDDRSKKSLETPHTSKRPQSVGGSPRKSDKPYEFLKRARPSQDQPKRRTK